jgi:signal transduction histidine kinase
VDTSLLDHLQTPILLVSSTGEVVYYNHICSTYFKLPPRKLNKLKTINELFSTQIDLAGYIKQCLENDAPQVSKEATIHLIEAELDYTVIMKFVPAQKQVLIHLWDLSIEKQLHEKYKQQIIELRETHEQILMSDKITALGELTAGLGHEISNPLTIIADRMMKMEEALTHNDTNEVADNLKDLQDGFQRINQIINNMQSFVRNQEDDVEICSLNQVIEDSIKFIHDLKVKTPINFVSKGGICFTMGNGLKLQQVIINLLKNSIDALEKVKDPHINIEIIATEAGSKIVIADNGPGIPENLRNEIFDMFFTTKDLGEGTGLGLSISQKIIEAHQGEIVLAEVQQGTTFVIELPSLEISSFSTTNKYLKGESEEEDPKVLIVGDDVSFLNRIYQDLKELHYIYVFSNNLEGVPATIDFMGADVVVNTQSKKLNLGDYTGTVINVESGNWNANQCTSDLAKSMGGGN